MKLINNPHQTRKSFLELQECSEDLWIQFDNRPDIEFFKELNKFISSYKDNNITVAIDNKDQKIFRISFRNTNYSWKGFKVGDTFSSISKVENLFVYEDFDQVFFPLSYKGICFETYDKDFSIKDAPNLKIDIITVYDPSLDERDKTSVQWNDVLDVRTGELSKNTMN